IVLPVLGTIMAPLAAVFLAEMVSPFHFILGYDVILPVIILWFMNNVLSKRPVTFSQVDVKNHPKLPPEGSFMLGGKPMPALPFALLVFILMTAFPIHFFVQNPNQLVSGFESGLGCYFFGEFIEECSFISMLMSITIILGIAFSIATYYYLSNFQVVKIQKEIENIEAQFELALFQLGNRISGGTPTELAIEEAIKDMKDLEISNLFKRTLHNIRMLGMTFKDALFNPEHGALRYYPSKLIKNVMYTIVDTARKGITYASEAMLRISSYLKSVRETQEYIRDLLTETTSSMKFQAYLLTPLITGMIVSMADIIIMVLVELGKYMDSLGMSSAMGMGFEGFSSLFGDVKNAISPSLFQLIVGIYVIEVIMILGIFLTKISKGENKPYQRYLIARMLVVGIVIYFVVAMMSKMVFGDLIKGALMGLGVGG
ncbi:MAG: hypothetical protein DRP15_02900, partial [Candidatus Aenigmatarchaeota archaeon]